MTAKFYGDLIFACRKAGPGGKIRRHSWPIDHTITVPKDDNSIPFVLTQNNISAEDWLAL